MFVGILASLLLIAWTLIDAFEAILQPRRVTHRFRYARLFYGTTWTIWRAAALRMPAGKRREAMLSIFAPLSLVMLLTNWVIGLVVGFAMMHWSLGTPLRPSDEHPGLATYLYLSGTTFFTLGYGDVTPTLWPGRLLAVIESGLGFGFLALVIGYLPVLYQAYSRREAMISLMDARAGSPPSAAELLDRLARSGDTATVDSLLARSEQWAGELLESHLSFPLLTYYRSQHDNQSWLAALTTILDVCAILMAKVKSNNSYQAQLTFAMARHAAVDLALVLKLPPPPPGTDRLPPAQLPTLRQRLLDAGLELDYAPSNDARLMELRRMYEPSVCALAERLRFALPQVVLEQSRKDNWQRSTPGVQSLPAGSSDDQHFD